MAIVIASISVNVQERFARQSSLVTLEVMAKALEENACSKRPERSDRRCNFIMLEVA